MIFILDIKDSLLISLSFREERKNRKTRNHLTKTDYKIITQILRCTTFNITLKH